MEKVNIGFSSRRSKRDFIFITEYPSTERDAGEVRTVHYNLNGRGRARDFNERIEIKMEVLEQTV